jgi:hypothetical protein
MKAWRWAVTLAACALAAGCTTTVTGAAIAGSTAIGSAPAPAPTPVQRTRTTCSGGTVIQPKGAPYCYLLPTGFNDATGQLTFSYESTNSSKYESAVAVGVHDAVIVAVYPLRENSDSLSASVLSDQVDTVLGQGESAGFTVAGDPVQTTVDNTRAFRTTIKQNDGQYAATIYFAFRGFTEIEINCQYSAKQSDIERGCTSVRQTIQITDPPK